MDTPETTPTGPVMLSSSQIDTLMGAAINARSDVRNGLVTFSLLAVVGCECEEPQKTSWFALLQHFTTEKHVTASWQRLEADRIRRAVKQMRAAFAETYCSAQKTDAARVPGGREMLMSLTAEQVADVFKHIDDMAERVDSALRIITAAFEGIAKNLKKAETVRRDCSAAKERSSEIEQGLTQFIEKLRTMYCIKGEGDRPDGNCKAP